jgi:hypothetical protein
VFWNPRGILNKEVEFKTFLNDQGAAYAGVSESQTYKDGANLTDERYAWEAGTEGCPSERGAGPSRGMGAFVDKRKAEASLIRTDKYAVWHRLSVPEGDDPLVVGVGYFPNAQDVRGHEEANAELSVALAYFREQGLRVIFGGDLNAHIGANGDLTPPDRAGRILLETVEFSDMMLVNTMPGKCIGGPSRVQVREDGTQSSTVDYVMCSPSLAPHVKSLVISETKTVLTTAPWCSLSKIVCSSSPHNRRPCGRCGMSVISPAPPTTGRGCAAVRPASASGSGTLNTFCEL